MEVLIDYLAFTDKGHNKEFWLEKLGLQDLKFETGTNRFRWVEHLYTNGVHVYDDEDGMCGFEFSGTGCRLLETMNCLVFDWYGLIKQLAEGPGSHISRLDVACDETDGVLTFEKMYRYVKAHKYISRARRAIWTDGDEQSIVFGSSKSDTRLRIYNKALERDVPDEHWTQAEFQFRDDAAASFSSNWVGQGGNLGKSFGGVLIHYLRFHYPAA